MPESHDSGLEPGGPPREDALEGNGQLEQRDASPSTEVSRGKDSLAHGWMRDHWDAMVAQARRYLHDPAAAEDAASEAFWAAWQRRDRLHDLSKARAWLLTFTRYRAKDALRARSRRPEHVSDELADAVTLREWMRSEDVRRDRIVALLPALPEVQAKIVRMLLDDCSDAEIADELGLKLGTLWVYKHRAIKKVRTIVCSTGRGTG